MIKKHYALSVASFLLIPVVMWLGAGLSNAINPEIAAGHPDYERNFRLLSTVKHLSFLAAALMSLALWLLAVVLLLKSKQRSYRWTPLALLGPLGIAVVGVLADKAPAPLDRYQQCIRRLNIPLRIVYELGFFAAVWPVAYQVVVIKRDFLIAREAAATGTSVAHIIDVQNASSGMWAFGEGLQVLYLVPLFYLLWPIVVNSLCRLAVAAHQVAGRQRR